MHYAAHCTDRPNSAELRAANRLAHRDWLKKYEREVKLGGPYLAADGVTMIGSLIVVEAPDEATARAMFAEEPYNKAGVFASMELRAFRVVVG